MILNRLRTFNFMTLDDFRFLKGVSKKTIPQDTIQKHFDFLGTPKDIDFVDIG